MSTIGPRDQWTRLQETSQVWHWMVEKFCLLSVCCNADEPLSTCKPWKPPLEAEYASANCSTGYGARTAHDIKPDIPECNSTTHMQKHEMMVEPPMHTLWSCNQASVCVHLTEPQKSRRWHCSSCASSRVVNQRKHAGRRMRPLMSDALCRHCPRGNLSTQQHSMLSGWQTTPHLQFCCPLTRRLAYLARACGVPAPAVGSFFGADQQALGPECATHVWPPPDLWGLEGCS